MLLSKLNSVWLFDVQLWHPTQQQFAQVLERHILPKNPEDVDRICKYHKGASRASAAYPRHNREDPKCFVMARLGLMQHFEHHHAERKGSSKKSKNIDDTTVTAPIWPPFSSSQPVGSDPEDPNNNELPQQYQQPLGPVYLARTVEGRPCLDMTHHYADYPEEERKVQNMDDKDNQNKNQEGRRPENFGLPTFNVNASHAGGCVLVASHPDALLGCDVMPIELAPPLDHRLVLPTAPSAAGAMDEGSQRFSENDYNNILEAYHDFYSTLFDNFTTAEWRWIYWGDANATTHKDTHPAAATAAESDDAESERRKLSNPKESVFPFYAGSSSAAQESGRASSAVVWLLQESLERFFVLWALKESLIKAIGVGLSFPLLSAEFRFLRTSDEEQQDGGDRESSLPPGPMKPSDPDFYHLPVVEAQPSQSSLQPSAEASAASRCRVELSINGQLDPEWEFTLFRYHRSGRGRGGGIDSRDSTGEVDPWATNPTVPVVGAVAVHPDRSKAATKSYRASMDLGRSSSTDVKKDLGVVLLQSCDF